MLLRKCGQVVEVKIFIRGTLLGVQGSCPDGHKLCWKSQPTVKGIAAGNLAAILFYGLTYTEMAELLNFPIFSESPFQKEY